MAGRFESIASPYAFLIAVVDMPSRGTRLHRNRNRRPVADMSDPLCVIAGWPRARATGAMEWLECFLRMMLTRWLVPRVRQIERPKDGACTSAKRENVGPYAQTEPIVDRAVRPLAPVVLCRP